MEGPPIWILYRGLLGDRAPVLHWFFRTRARNRTGFPHIMRNCSVHPGVGRRPPLAPWRRSGNRTVAPVIRSHGPAGRRPDRDGAIRPCDASSDPEWTCCQKRMLQDEIARNRRPRVSRGCAPRDRDCKRPKPRPGRCAGRSLTPLTRPKEPSCARHGPVSIARNNEVRGDRPGLCALCLPHLRGRR